jgi:hypothetical protein
VTLVFGGFLFGYVYLGSGGLGCEGLGFAKNAKTMLPKFEIL